MSTKRIDVLAAIDDLVACADYNAGGGYEIEDDSYEVRDAVAALIKALRASDELIYLLTPFESTPSVFDEIAKTRFENKVVLTRVGAA